MLKRFIATSATVALVAGLLAGCGSDAGKAGAYKPKELKVQFVPSQAADTLEAKAKPLEKLLKKELGIPVKVSVSTDYNTIIEAMASKQVDVGFLPPSAYVMAHDKKKAANVLLQSQRFGVNPKNGKPTDKLVDSYEAYIITKKDSKIKTLKDLKGKKMAWQDVASSAGYVWPAVEMKKAGIDPQKDVTGVTMKGHDRALIAVLNGEVDAAAVFGDARNIVAKDYKDVFSKTKVIHRTKPIPNDTISVRSDIDKKWAEKIKQAFIKIGKNKEGHKIIKEIYTHEGYIPSSDKNFGAVRDYEKAVGQY
ncbi:phosphonate transport system substrate-binding protein [Marininema mesophilum]|uniref:Phosphonate transport system substrate-binding protein n=1 Tax=Marininema mesophilum TaxID=1048340 RepID=A0A1H3CRJ4_9BACL|nr:phosphate/phosphite/phosphonate ABC transporter substrate-binding protein [Marininema mesophilum]SDX56668.1 phosphonate transport system substrate-binding protein [Marininema mesophilum]SDX56773.1 phosphonate transport system substrate-binding protein [Marininema mesophilum]